MTATVMDLSEYVRHLDRAPAKVRAAALRGVRDAAQRAVPELVRRTRIVPAGNPGKIGSGAVNTGDLARRWQWQATQNGADVFNDKPYASVIEGGRRRGAKMPPVGGGTASGPVRQRVHGPTGRVQRTRPSVVMTDLMLWVKRKLNVAAGPIRQRVHGPTGKVTVTRPRVNMSESMLRSVTFLVARAISKRGLAPRPIMTSREFVDWLRERAAEAIGHEVAKALTEGGS